MILNYLLKSFLLLLFVVSLVIFIEQTLGAFAAYLIIVPILFLTPKLIEKF